MSYYISFNKDNYQFVEKNKDFLFDNTFFKSYKSMKEVYALTNFDEITYLSLHEDNSAEEGDGVDMNKLPKNLIFIESLGSYLHSYGGTYKLPESLKHLGDMDFYDSDGNSINIYNRLILPNNIEKVNYWNDVNKLPKSIKEVRVHITAFPFKNHKKYSKISKGGEIIWIPTNNETNDIDISHLDNLTKLDLNYQGSIFKIKFPSYITELNISNCKYFKECYNKETIKQKIRNNENLDPIDLNQVLQFPNSLIKLSCQNSNISVLPDLINNLVELNCSNCFIKELPILPISLEILNCSNNKMKRFPILSDNIVRFIGDKNDFKEISILPSNINYLSVNDTYISDFNNYLPDSLEYLSCQDCDIHQLPSKLPIKLKNLYCSNNFLRVLPNLPNSLEFLNCQNNKIKLIRYLPENLKSFLYDNNPGIEINTKLPRGISR
jgi:hypothetical protein